MTDCSCPGCTELVPEGPVYLVAGEVWHVHCYIGHVLSRDATLRVQVEGLKTVLLASTVAMQMSRAEAPDAYLVMGNAIEQAEKLV